MPGYMVEVKLIYNFSKIPKICNIFSNKGALLKHLSSTRSHKYDAFTDSHYTPFSSPSFSLTLSKLVQKTTPVYMNENCLRWQTATATARNANQWTNWFHSQQNWRSFTSKKLTWHLPKSFTFESVKWLTFIHVTKWVELPQMDINFHHSEFCTNLWLKIV